MNIYAKNGDQVYVTEESINNGYASDRKVAKQYLTVGKIYTVNYTVVDNWHTSVELMEFPGITFNSVTFVDGSDI